MKISELPAFSGTPNENDLLVLVRGNTTYRIDPIDLGTGVWARQATSTGNYRTTDDGVFQVLNPTTGLYHSLSVTTIEGEAHLVIDPTGAA